MTASTATITIAAVGDCALGRNQYIDYLGSWDNLFNREGAAYFFKNVKGRIQGADIAIANLEGALTDDAPQKTCFHRLRTDKAALREYLHGGKRAYASALVEGGFNVVTFANNHNLDYGLQGFLDTIDACKQAGLDIAYYDHVVRKVVNGITVGILSVDATACTPDIAEWYVRAGLADLRRDCALVVCCMHWGQNYVELPNEEQTRLGHLCIDLGADVVFGCHAHILQGVERYKGRYIFYSMGNFSYGGRAVPKDVDTGIFKQTFTFVDGKLAVDDNVEFVPCWMSQKADVNDFCPLPQNGEAGQAIIDKVNERSLAFGMEFDAHGRPSVDPAFDVERPPCGNVSEKLVPQDVPEAVSLLLDCDLEVGPGMFADTDAQAIELPMNCAVVKAGAFARHENLARVVLPENIRSIEEGAFPLNCTATFWCVQGSYAARRIAELCPSSHIRLFRSTKRLCYMLSNLGVTSLESKRWDAVTDAKIRAVMNESGWSYAEAATCLERAYADQGLAGVTAALAPYKAKRASLVAGLSQSMARGLAAPEPGGRLTRTSRVWPARRIAAREQLARQIKAQAIEVGTLCDFLGLSLPASLAHLENATASSIAYVPNDLEKNCVFVCRKSWKLAAVKAKRAGALCAIGDPSTSVAFEAEGVPFIPGAPAGEAITRMVFMTEIAALWRKQFPRMRTACIVGGSDTSAITALAGAVCRQSGNALVSRKGAGLPGNIARLIENASDETDALVCGASSERVGFVEFAARMLAPDVFVIADAGGGHVKGFEDGKDSFLYELLAVDRRAADTAVGVVCFDDARLCRAPFIHKVVGFSIDNPDADFKAENITCAEGLITFDVVEKTGNSTPVGLHAEDDSYVYDALAAFAVGVQLGIDRTLIARAIGDRTANVR